MTVVLGNAFVIRIMLTRVGKIFCEKKPLTRNNKEKPQEVCVCWGGGNWTNVLWIKVVEQKEVPRRWGT